MNKKKKKKKFMLQLNLELIKQSERKTFVSKCNHENFGFFFLNARSTVYLTLLLRKADLPYSFEKKSSPYAARSGYTLSDFQTSC